MGGQSPFMIPIVKKKGYVMPNSTTTKACDLELLVNFSTYTLDNSKMECTILLKNGFELTTSVALDGNYSIRSNDDRIAMFKKAAYYKTLGTLIGYKDYVDGHNYTRSLMTNPRINCPYTILTEQLYPDKINTVALIGDNAVLNKEFLVRCFNDLIKDYTYSLAKYSTVNRPAILYVDSNHLVVDAIATRPASLTALLKEVLRNNTSNSLDNIRGGFDPEDMSPTEINNAIGYISGLYGSNASILPDTLSTLSAVVEYIKKNEPSHIIIPEVDKYVDWEDELGRLITHCQVYKIVLLVSYSGNIINTTFDVTYQTEPDDNGVAIKRVNPTNFTMGYVEVSDVLGDPIPPII